MAKPPEHSATHEYMEGYNNALSGHASNDGSNAAVQLLTLGFGGNARSSADSYWKGYRDGRNDKK